MIHFGTKCFQPNWGRGQVLINVPSTYPLGPTWDRLFFPPAFPTMCAPTHRIISLNLFNSNYGPRRSGTWVLRPWIAPGQQWADWMAIGSLESSHGMSARGHCSSVRQVDASRQWMELKILYPEPLS